MKIAPLCVAAHVSRDVQVERSLLKRHTAGRKGRNDFLVSRDASERLASPANKSPSHAKRLRRGSRLTNHRIAEAISAAFRK